ncbi:hypothetical protein [Paraburkholderia sp. BCC1886]|uniref:hypothetical protein n=1 Tax=Paraburkholderia sp. BCC1886 TaxID=2562670 RepID=UPI0011826C3D|nr:hypothetical protein [Paraburkholderia sp. BCC1886]
MHNQHHALLRTVHIARATLEKFDEQAKPVGPLSLQQRLDRAEHTKKAMDEAELVLNELHALLDKFAGTRLWNDAMALAFAPNDHEDYQRVVEYHHRIDQLSAMLVTL